MYVASSLSSDGRTLLIGSNKSGFDNVALLDTATKKMTPVTDAQWEADAGHFAPAGSTFTYVLDKDGRTEIYLARSNSSQHELIEFPEGLTYLSGNPTPFSPQGDRLLVGHQSSRRPSDLWIYDLASKHAVQLTFSAIASLNPANLSQSQLVHYKSFDGKVISAFVWIPFNLQRNGTVPGIAPLLVLQGDNDIRVPKEEAEQVVGHLKKEGRTVDAHYYPNEGHGFSKRENQIDAMNRTIRVVRQIFEARSRALTSRFE